MAVTLGLIILACMQTASYTVGQRTFFTEQKSRQKKLLSALLFNNIGLQKKKVCKFMFHFLKRVESNILRIFSICHELVKLVGSTLSSLYQKGTFSRCYSPFDTYRRVVTCNWNPGVVGLDIHWFQKKSPKKDFWQSFVVWNRTRDSTRTKNVEMANRTVG